MSEPGCEFYGHRYVGDANCVYCSARHPSRRERWRFQGRSYVQGATCYTWRRMDGSSAKAVYAHPVKTFWPGGFPQCDGVGCTFCAESALRWRER